MTTLQRTAPQPSRIPPCHHCGGRVVRRRDVNDVYLQCSSCGRFPESPRVEMEVETEPRYIPHQDQPYRQEYLNDRVPSPSRRLRKSDHNQPQQDKEIAVLAQTTTDADAALPLPEDIHNMTNEQAIALTQRVRWPDGPQCPRCGSKNVSSQTKYQPQPYRCHECKAYYSHRHGSFIRTKLYTKPWLAAISATIQIQRLLTLEEFLDATRRKPSRAATEAHQIYCKAAELIDLDPDRAPYPDQATRFLNISEDLVPQDLHSKDATLPASADPEPAQVEQPDPQPAAGSDPVAEVSEPSDSEPAAANPESASPESAEGAPTSPDPKSQQEQPEAQQLAGNNDPASAGDETPPSPPERERPRDLEDTAQPLLSRAGNPLRRPGYPGRTSRTAQNAAKPKTNSDKANSANADAGMFSHDPEPANEVEQQHETMFQISEKPQCPENGMLQGLAATIAALSQEQRKELDAILNTTITGVISSSAAESAKPAVAESPEPDNSAPGPESTEQAPHEAIQQPEQPLAVDQDAQPARKSVLSAQRPVGVRYHSFGPHHA